MIYYLVFKTKFCRILNSLKLFLMIEIQYPMRTVKNNSDKGDEHR